MNRREFSPPRTGALLARDGIITLASSHQAAHEDCSSALLSGESPKYEFAVCPLRCMSSSRWSIPLPLAYLQAFKEERSMRRAWRIEGGDGRRAYATDRPLRLPPQALITQLPASAARAALLHRSRHPLDHFLSAFNASEGRGWLVANSTRAAALSTELICENTF